MNQRPRKGRRLHHHYAPARSQITRYAPYRSKAESEQIGTYRAARVVGQASPEPPLSFRIPVIPVSTTLSARGWKRRMHDMSVSAHGFWRCPTVRRQSFWAVRLVLNAEAKLEPLGIPAQRREGHQWRRLMVTGWPGRPAGAGGVSGTPTAVTNMGAVAVRK